MEGSKAKCPVWGSIAWQLTSSGNCIFNSPRCGGTFSISPTALVLLNKSFPPEKKVALVEWLRQCRKLSIPTLITSAVLDELATCSISISEKLDRALLWIGAKSQRLGEKISFRTQSYYETRNVNVFDPDATAHIANLLELAAECALIGSSEALQVLKYCQSQGFLDANSGEYEFSLTYKGHQRVEELLVTQKNSSQAFVAMWFSSTMDEVYQNGFVAGVLDAGYMPVRVDVIEHNNKIDDQIVAEIRRSKFVIADFTSEVVDRLTADGTLTKDTHARGGVYFEAGFAKGLGKEVIWTVREDVLPFVHFDTRQFSHIVWKDATDLSAQLSRRISATLGDGPNKRTP